MDCGKVSEQLGFYIDGALNEQQLEQIETHLAGCAECRAELASLKMLIGAAGQIEDIDPPSSLRARIAAATTNKPEAEVRAPILARLREILSPRALKLASGFAGAAAVAVMAFVVLTHPGTPITPTASRTNHPTPTAAATRPIPSAPPKVALTAPIAANRTIPSQLVRKHITHRRSSTVARKPVTSVVKLVAKAKVRDTRGLHTASATKPMDDTALIDDTTVAEVVTPNDIQQSAPKTSDTVVKQKHSKLAEVASSLALKQDNTEKWMQQMKEQAAMRQREHGSVGMSLINARF